MDSLRAGAESICATLSNAGHRALFAGGCVRDTILGIAPKDYDIATSARPADVAALFPRTIPVGEAYGVVLVVLPQGTYEVAAFRKDGPYDDGRHPSHVEYTDEERDALRRDFTINALFYDPGSDQVIDYVGGREDIAQRTVRCVGDPETRFREDHLRLLRAVRFAARLQYALEPGTHAAMTDLSALCVRTSSERIRDELVKMLTEGAAGRAFRLLDECGMLAHVLPEVDRLKGVDQPPRFHPEGDVFTHTMLMLDLLTDATPSLAMGVLLHDIGKPDTMTVTDRIRFHNHDKTGADMARDVCRRLRMPNDETDRIVWLVGQHMRLAHAPQMRPSKLKRFVREEGFRELLELCRIDCLASHSKLDVIEWLEDYLSTAKPEEIRPDPLLTGRDLIRLGYRPGPLFSEILAAVEDAQLEGAIATKPEAESLVAKRWPIDTP